MSDVHVFNAGPCLLPSPVYDRAVEAVRSFAGTGVSVLSISHRSRDWERIMEETGELWKKLLDIPSGYEVLFLAGGASMEFLRVPMNFLERKAAYLDTGIWSGKALKEASGLGATVVVASSSDRGYTYIPKGYSIPEDVDYFHITTSNTVYGTRIKEDFDSPVPLIADMSSDILTRPVDVGRYALIYGGAQKNAGTAGVSFVIVKKDALGNVSRYLPSMLDYRVLLEHKSMFNTPPVFPIFVMHETLQWTLENGGVARMQELSAAKAGLLYAEIDRNPLFRGVAETADRSDMNVTFRMSEGNEGMEQDFLNFASARGIVGINGHRYAGGFRASIYNACTLEDVKALVEVMRDFENR